MTSTLLLTFAVIALVAQSVSPTFERRTFKMPDGSTGRYGLAVPGDYRASSPRPLVIALHPGGGGTPYYGDQYMRTIFVPRHEDLFSAAIVMAGRTEEPLTNLARIPTYVIHSRNDQVVPFAQAEQRAAALTQMGSASWRTSRSVRETPVEQGRHSRPTVQPTPRWRSPSDRA